MAITNKLKRFVEKTLRDFLRVKFTSDSDYTYTSNIRTQKIRIEEEFPVKLQTTKVPYVVIGDVTGDVSKRFIGTGIFHTDFEEAFIEGMTIGLTFYSGTTNYIPIREYKGGDYQLATSIEVASLDENQVDDVCDKITEYFYDYLSVLSYGVIIKNIRQAAKGERVIGNDVLINASIPVELISGWYEAITITGTRIGKIIIEAPVIGLDGATL